MKKLTLILLVVTLAIPVFSQDIGSAWINSQDPFFTSLDGGLDVAPPSSILAYVSNGIFKDELDMVLRNPFYLKDFSGYTLWTAYGNYETLNNGLNTPSAGGGEIDPFGTTTLDDTNIGNFQAGIAMPMPFMSAWRIGLLGGRQYTKAGNIDDGAAGTWFTHDLTASTTDDVDLDGTIDSTTATTGIAKDETVTQTWRYIAGANIGFMGVSLYSFNQSSTRNVGGSYDYAWTVGTDADQIALLTDVDTSLRSLYGVKAWGTDAAGTEAEGKAAGWPSASTNAFGLIGQLPLNLLGLELPLSARLGFDLYDGTGSTSLPVRYIQDVAYVAGGPAAEVSTYNWTGNIDLTAVWDAQAPAAFAYEPTEVLDPKQSGTGYFATTIDASVDPSFKVAEQFTVKPRVGLSYNLGIRNTASFNAAYSDASIADGAALANSVWSYSSVTDAPSNEISNNISFDLGTLGFFENEAKTLSLGVGLYAKPYFKLRSTSYENEVTTTNRSWNDTTAVDDTNNAGVVAAIGGGLAAGASLIGTGADFEGTSAYTSTTARAEGDKDNEIGIRFAIPVSAKLSFFKDKLQLVGGYLIQHDNSITYSYTSGTTVTETLVVNNSAGSPIFDSDTDPASDGVASSLSSAGHWDTTTNAVWAGQMGFMLRWAPTRNMTIDFEGSSLLDSLENDLGDLLSFNNGLIQFTQIVPFIENLSMSVTFHF